MYNYLSGKVTEVGESRLVLDCSGIGYELTVTSRCISELGTVGEQVKIYTHLNVREDEMSLFGFADKGEKSFFLKLLSVSGIGPKVAISILGSAKLSDLMRAIALGDIAQLSKIKGIGKKTAERLVVELKDKISSENLDLTTNSGTMPSIVPVNDDAVMALMSLGFAKQEALIAVMKVEKSGMSTEQVIMQALKG